MTALTSKWICFPFSETPRVLTEADITNVPQDTFNAVHERVKLIYLLRSAIAEDIKSTLRSADASKLCDILHHATMASGHLDKSAVSDYVHAVEEISTAMQGYPRELRSKLRLLKDANEGKPAETRFTFYTANTDDNQKTRKNGSSIHFFSLPQELRSQVYELLLYRGTI